MSTLPLLMSEQESVNCNVEDKIVEHKRSKRAATGGTESEIINLTYPESRANMSPAPRVCGGNTCPDRQQNMEPSVSIVFAETAEEDLVNRVLGMLLQAQYDGERSGD